jgi:putative hydrolase of the HAD superfamily
VRAVIFDLWDTVVEWRADIWAEVNRRSATAFGMTEDDFVAKWQETYHRRQIGPIAEALRAFGGDERATAAVLELRREYTRTALVPRPGAPETLRALKDRGLRAGLISVCSEEVPALWPRTQFAELFDSTVFSCSVGLAKPDPRIYRLACKELGVEPEDAMFVGDGANDELAGAVAVGMSAVLFVPPERDAPFWPEVHDWHPRVRELPQILELVDERSYR